MPAIVATPYRDPLLKEAPAVQGYSTTQPETKTPLPWGIDPGSSYLDYRCWTETELDPGLCLHKPLPQSNPQPDTLGLIDCQADNLDKFTPPPSGGVNLASRSLAVDVIQRMATSTYRFVLRGHALRVGWQIPIPSLVAVGEITPVPVWPQRATNVIVGNFCGIPIFHAVWELHYIVQQTPSSGSQAGVPVPYNPYLQMRPDQQLPDTIQAPVSMKDMEHQNPVIPPGGGIIRPAPLPEPGQGVIHP